MARADGGLRGGVGLVDEDEARRRLAAARVARLATVTPEGRPHVVPCCFAPSPDGRALYTAVDAKPKSTLALRRLDNLRANPRASLLVDHYDDRDWSRLWWVRVDATAEVLGEGAGRRGALELLVARYDQYRRQLPPGPVIALTELRWRSWP